MGSDEVNSALNQIDSVFQSTLPAWGATEIFICYRNTGDISIHAPRMGSDFVACASVRIHGDFNPRSPHGERLAREKTRLQILRISIHALRMGSDVYEASYAAFRGISIHAPRMGSDHSAQHWHFPLNFISIHAPRMGSDINSDKELAALYISIHAPRMGSDCILLRLLSV